MKLFGHKRSVLCVFIKCVVSGHVHGLAWNQDGQCLASVGDSGEEVFLSAICGKSEANIGVVRGIVSWLMPMFDLT